MSLRDAQRQYLSQLPKSKEFNPNGFIVETGLSSIGARSYGTIGLGGDDILKQIDNNLNSELEFNIEAKEDEYANLIKEETIDEQRADLISQQQRLKRRLESLDKQEEAQKLKM